MALNSGKILMRRGQEVNFDPNKMMPGEWAVSLDSKFVRMCFSPGVCVRMATYEAFEADMEQIRQILAECESIEQAVSLINTEVSQNAKAVIEHTKEAKQYRDEAKQYRDEAFSTTPDGYDSLVGQVDKNTVAINTIVEKAELNIKETAMGENIHLDDSAEGKAVEFALYGKATQDGTPTPQNPQEIEVSGESYNLLENTATSQTISGVTFTVNEDKSVTANGTATAQITFDLIPRESAMFTDLIGEELILSGCPIGGGQNIYQLQAFTTDFTSGATDRGSGLKFALTDSIAYAYITIFSGVTVDNVTFKPMIRKASVKNDRYMPYGKGSVEVKSVGKNLQNPINIFNGYPDASATSKVAKFIENNTTRSMFFEVIGEKEYTVSLSKAGNRNIIYFCNSIPTEFMTEQYYYNLTNATSKNQFSFVAPIGYKYCAIYIGNDFVQDETIEIQAERGIVATPYEPYKETVSTIPTTDFAGIPVSSGGNYTDSDGQQWIANEIVKYADGSGKKIQRVDVDTLGNYDYTASVFNGDIYAFVSVQPISNALFSNTSKLLCETFTASGTGANNTMYITGTGNIRCFTSSYTTAEEFKTAMLNTKLVYELAEPIHTPLTAEEIAEIEKLSTFYPVTNISNDFDCGMKVKYIVDSKNYIDNQLAIQAKLQEEALLNMLLLMPEEVQASMIEKDTNNLLNESEV